MSFVQMKKNERRLLEGNIIKGFFFFALPLFLGSLFQQLYGTVDLVFVGNILGKRDAAAVGASSILVTCLIGLFTGVSVGAGVVTSFFYGSGEREEARESIRSALVLALIGGVVLTVAGEALARPALMMLNTPKSVMPHALVYIRIYLLAILPMIFYNMGASILRALGDSRTPFFVLAAGGGLNVALDALFIAVLRLGVAGAAAATAASQTFTAVAVTVLLSRRERTARQRRLDWGMGLRIVKVGLPLGIQAMVLTLSNLIVQYFINGFGENAVAAFTVYFKAEDLIYLPIMAFGQAMVTFAGQNYGAGQYDRIRRAAVQCSLFSACLILGLSLAILANGRWVLSWFGRDEAVIREGLRIIRITFPFYFIYAILEVTGGVVRGLGKTLPSMLIVIICLCAVRIILLSLLISRFPDIRTVALVYPVTWALAALSFIILAGGMFRKRPFTV